MTQNTVGVHCYDILAILFREVIAVYCENNTEHINVMLQNAECLTATNDCRYRCHWASKFSLQFKLYI